MMSNSRVDDARGRVAENIPSTEARPHDGDPTLRLIPAQPVLGDETPHPLGRVPYMTVQAFCETQDLVSIINQAVADRRLSRADVTVSYGGLRGAVQFFAAHATPDLLLVESSLAGNALFHKLDEFSEVCDADTKVVLIGPVNDISFYRRLVERGIADYLVAPIEPLGLINAALRLFPQNEARRLGKIAAFIGAKGGTGSSTIAQNTAWCMANEGVKVLLADMDLQFGTAALNYNIDAPVGFTEQIAGAERLDEAFFERLLHNPAPNLSVLAGATASRDVIPPTLEVLDRILDCARAAFPSVLLDLPHEWTPWVRQALLSADEVIVTAEPDLANLRNMRTMLDLLKAARPNDPDPLLVLNRFGVARRDEIRAEDFAKALGVPLRTKVGFAPRAFSRAGNGGQMIAEISAEHGKPFVQLARVLSGRAPAKNSRGFPRWRRKD